MMPYYVSGGSNQINRWKYTMSDETKQYEERIKELEKELAEAKKDDGFKDLKKKYEEIIQAKDEEIAKLNETVETTKQQVDTTVTNLNDEVQAKLEANEKLAELNKQVEELVRDKAEATVDTFIQQGKILPAQRETTLKLCLNDNDTFLDLYKDAKPIIDTTTAPKSRRVNDTIVDGLKDYFKQ